MDSAMGFASHKLLLTSFLKKLVDLDLNLLKKSDNFYNYRFKKLADDYNTLRSEFRELVERNASKSIKKTVLNLLEIFNLNEKNLVPTYVPEEYNVFGCELSTDVDIVCSVPVAVLDQINRKEILVDTSHIEQKFKAPCDFNFCYIENGNVQATTKGGKELQNMVLATYHLHPQEYPCFFTAMISIPIEDRISSSCKFILDNMKVLLREEYYSERQKRRDMYSLAGKERIRYTVDLCQKIIFDDYDLIKSLTMKFIQLTLHKRDVYSYRKLEMAELFDGLYPGTKEAVTGLLTRRNVLAGKDAFNCLIAEYREAVENMRLLEWKEFGLNLTKNPTDLSDELFTDFIWNPLVPSRYFKKMFPETDKIGSLFPIKSKNVHLLPDLSIVETCDQRSEEWLRLLKFYSCGKNTGVLELPEGHDPVEFYYNLIRGCLVEAIVIDQFRFQGYEQVCVGFLTEAKTEKSVAIAPDLLLVNGEEIIPIEIKCLPCQPADNKTYRRAIELAEKELSSVKKILKTERGIVVLVWVWEGGGFLCQWCWL